MAERLPGGPEDYSPGLYNIPPVFPTPSRQAFSSAMTPLQEALAAAGLTLGAVFTPAPTPPSYSDFSYRPTAVTPPWVARDPRMFAGPNQLPGDRDDRLSYFTGMAPDLGDDRVFMGKMTSDEVPQPHIGIPGEGPAEVGPETQPDSMTVKQAADLPYLWSDEKIEETMKRMRAAGEDVSNFDEMLDVWVGMVTRASRIFTLSKGDRMVTPWDVLTSMKKENIEAGVIDKDGNIVQEQVHKSVFEVSDGDAWGTLRDAMTNMLGRAPTDQEVRDFTSRMSNLANADPTTTTTVSRTDPETGNVQTETEQDEGFGADDMAHEAFEEMEDSPEYGAYQAAAMYFNVLEDAIGGLF